MAVGQFAILDREKGELHQVFNRQEAANMMVGGLVDKADELNEEHGTDHRFAPVNVVWRAYRVYSSGIWRLANECETEEEAEEFIEESEEKVADDVDCEYKVKPSIQRVFGMYG